MLTGRLVSLVLVFLLVLTPAAAARHDNGKKADGGLQLHKNLPRDPVVVLGMWLEDPEGGFQTLAGLFERFSVESVEQDSAPALGGLDPELAAWLRAELLPRIGPELTLALDLPPIDEAVAALQISRDDALSALLRGAAGRRGGAGGGRVTRRTPGGGVRPGRAGPSAGLLGL
jgi:hypothetical protein